MITSFRWRMAVSTHSRLKAAGLPRLCAQRIADVSTHSRLKAAGFLFPRQNALNHGFNTQPPEGGWLAVCRRVRGSGVSTHSRLKAAGILTPQPPVQKAVSTHSRLKAAG